MPDRDPAVQNLIDREAIRDCLHRYCRGIDRCDVETLRSVYWPEAVDNHVYFNGNAWEFAEWVVPLLRGRQRLVGQRARHADHAVVVGHNHITRVDGRAGADDRPPTARPARRRPPPPCGRANPRKSASNP